jgi:hypothetical protein
MANVTLSKYECTRGVLPRVCMRCGAPADETKTKTFSWFHPLIYLALLAGFLPFLIIALVLTKRMTVDAPFCHEHRGHWIRRTLLVTGTLLVVLALGIGAIVYMSDQPPGAKDDLSGYLCIGAAVLLFAWLVLSMIVSLTAIRTTEITDRTITLAGVDEQFIAALEEDRERDREDRRDRRRRYDDVRDDYDDELEPPARPRRRRDSDDRDDDDDRRRPRYDDRDDRGDDRPPRRRDE